MKTPTKFVEQAALCVLALTERSQSLLLAFLEVEYRRYIERAKLPISDTSSKESAGNCTVVNAWLNVINKKAGENEERLTLASWGDVAGALRPAHQRACAFLKERGVETWIQQQNEKGLAPSSSGIARALSAGVMDGRPKRMAEAHGETPAKTKHQLQRVRRLARRLHIVRGRFRSGERRNVADLRRKADRIRRRKFNFC